MLARKPLIGTVAANVLAHGTGALNIDGCRVEGEPWKAHTATGLGKVKFFTEGETPEIDKAPHALGRWPANLIHDGSDEVLGAFAAFGESKSTARVGARAGKATGVLGAFAGQQEVAMGHDDSGSPARFFYCAKASRADRNAGCGELPDHAGGMNSNTSGQHITRRDGWKPEPVKNNHPTVKPTSLMRYLVRLVTPPGGLVLDPFTGSGSTGRGALLEGFRFLGIEYTPEYVEIAEARCADAQTAYAEAQTVAASPTPKKQRAASPAFPSPAVFAATPAAFAAQPLF